MTKKIMYSLAILFSIAFFVSSCKKDAVDKKADEDLAASVAGQYEMNYISINGKGDDLPSGSISGKINITNKDKTTADIIISITDTEDSNNSGSDTLKDVLLKEENSAIILYYQTTKIGTINSNELTIAISNEQGQEIIFKAKK